MTGLNIEPLSGTVSVPAIRSMLAAGCTLATLEVDDLTHTVDRGRILEPGDLECSIACELSGESSNATIVVGLSALPGLSLHVHSQVGVSSNPDIGAPTVAAGSFHYLPALSSRVAWRIFLPALYRTVPP